MFSEFTTMHKRDMFGYTDIKSNTYDAISNNYQNVDDLRRELQGKPISVKTINDALKKVKFSKYGTASVHSFYPDAGKAFVGNNGHASVVISWDVSKVNVEGSAQLLCEGMKQLNDTFAKLGSAFGNFGTWTKTTIINNQ